MFYKWGNIIKKRYLNQTCLTKSEAAFRGNLSVLYDINFTSIQI